MNLRPSIHQAPCETAPSSTRPVLPCAAHRTSHTEHGFMLVELLMAMFILALGLSALAAIFPVASYLQKQTFNATVGQQVELNARTVLTTVHIPASPLAGIANDQKVYSLPQSVFKSDGQLPRVLRCYPTALDLNNDGKTNDTDEDPNALNREFYWVPLVQDKDADASIRDWSIFVFILAKQPNGTYSTKADATDANYQDGSTVPQVRSVSVTTGTNSLTCASDPNLQPGDMILGDNGMTMTVTDVSNGGKTLTVNSQVANNIGSPSAIWYAPPVSPGQSSPTVKILVLGSEAVK